MAQLKTLSVLRMRNKNFVTYMRDFHDKKAEELRATNPHLKHAHLYHYPVAVHFPECLFTGKILKRDTEYCQFYTEHNVFLVENGTFAAYFKTLQQATDAVEQQPELHGSQVTEVTVKLQDIEALCHGQATAILSDEMRDKLFKASMTSILHPNMAEMMYVTDSYAKAEQLASAESSLSRELEVIEISENKLEAVA